jgi:2',3'-cyclic-nucleotide 2'-phosphodiesterase (5'-nucleotidase family)
MELLLVLWWYWYCSAASIGPVFVAAVASGDVVGAQQPLPQPDLPFGDINVLILTDTHSWVGGHGPNEPHLNADYGDVLSFYQRLKQFCDDHAQHDLYFVMNGDWIDGTGLSLNGDTFSLTQILEKMPWDAVNLGNHELYRVPVLEFMLRPGGFVQWWGDRYLTSNVVVATTMQPIGRHYRVLRGTKTTVLTFGFLYNMIDNVDYVIVKKIEAVVQEPWFAEALHSEEFDAILVMAHMGARDPLVHVILNKIRQELGPEMPVQFVTGHTHIRDYTTVDNVSSSFEAGRFLDTVGFVSFPSRTTVALNGTTTNSTAVNLFKHIYLDANKDTLKEALNVESLPTVDGAELSTLIDEVQEEMGLTEEVGCVQQTYYLENAIDADDSLWGFFSRELLPTQFRRDQIVLLNKGGWRYDMVAGRQRLDDVIAVSPFNETMYEWTDMSPELILLLNATLNADPELFYLSQLPNYILAHDEPLDMNKRYALVTGTFEVSFIQRAMALIDPNTTAMLPLATMQTSTSIWVTHIREHSPCSTSGQDGESPVRPGQQNMPSRNKTHTGHPGSSSSEDALRLSLVTMSAAVVVILASIHVWQRGRTFQRLEIVREQVISEALREYYDEGYRDDVNDEVDEDCSDSIEDLEGEFTIC